MKEIKDYIDKYAAMLPMSTSLSVPDAEKRAAEFLVVQAHIANWAHLLREEKIKFTSIQSAVYSELLSKCAGKTITQDKITVEAHPDYIKAREDLERIENDLSYLKAYQDLFNNGHIFFRQLSKES